MNHRIAKPSRRKFLGLAAAAPLIIAGAGDAGLPRLDLKADCGAAGDGRADDTAALQKAAAIIQKAGGGELTIPPGVYIVGRQAAKADPEAPGPFYQAEPMFAVQGLTRLKISGPGAKLRIADGLRYGGFDPKTGRPADSKGARPFAAQVGRMFEISSSTNVLIEGLELDGNNEALVLGGQWGDVDRQAAATGIWVNMCRDVRIVDVHTHHHGLDGIAVLHLGGPPPRRMPHQLLRVNSEYNGRQGLSWIGGWGLECLDCKFNHTGRAVNGGKPMMSKPRAGLDIEPNARTTQISREGVFTRCEFINNTGAGVVAAAGDGGYSTFTDCTIWGTTSYSLYITKPGMKFLKCRIYGTAVHASDGRTEASPKPDPALATSFTDCTFEDKEWQNGEVFRNNNLYTLGTDKGEGVAWTRCTFVSHKVRGIHVADPATTEIFDKCTFIHGHAGLSDGTYQSQFKGCRLKSCRFEETPEVSKGARKYFISVENVSIAAPGPGEPPTRVEGPNVKWQSAADGLTGEIKPGKYE